MNDKEVHANEAVITNMKADFDHYSTIPNLKEEPSEKLRIITKNV